MAGVERSRARQEPRDIQSWSDVFDELSRADRSDRLGAEELERLAVAAYLVYVLVVVLKQPCPL